MRKRTVRQFSHLYLWYNKICLKPLGQRQWCWPTPSQLGNMGCPQRYSRKQVHHHNTSQNRADTEWLWQRKRESCSLFPSPATHQHHIRMIKLCPFRATQSSKAYSKLSGIKAQRVLNDCLCSQSGRGEMCRLAEPWLCPEGLKTTSWRP